ncbi:hypothetical protein [Streptomyces sp. NPDC001833]|uniref:hypothetical protein n=1 Tax=Streptomyces sp. NPDC001833 TaxID=3154658 RepID=UPI00332F92CF
MSSPTSTPGTPEQAAPTAAFRGRKDDHGRLHLTTVNTRLANRTFTSLPAEQIDQAMTVCVSRRQVLILGCCHSGAFPAGRLAEVDTDVHALERFQGQGRTVLTASDAAQHAFEGDRLHGSGAVGTPTGSSRCSATAGSRGSDLPAPPERCRNH